MKKSTQILYNSLFRLSNQAVLILEAISSKGEQLEDGRWIVPFRQERFAAKVVNELINTTFKINTQPFATQISWCSAAQSYAKGEDWYIAFDLPCIVQKLLPELALYIKVHQPHLNPMKNESAVILYQLLKAENSKVIRELQFPIEVLKQHFGLEEKYNRFKHFNHYLKTVVLPEIEKTDLKIISMSKSKKYGRAVTHLRFVYTDKFQKGNVEDGQFNLKTFPYAEPTPKELSELSFAQMKAYKFLTGIGVYSGIAARQILGSIMGDQAKGFEDYFVKAAWTYFQQHATVNNVGNFVNWWISKKAFHPSEGVAWTKVNEQVVRERKELQSQSSQKHQNRLLAKTMTHEEFVREVRSQTL